jgi:hypothetical protein
VNSSKSMCRLCQAEASEQFRLTVLGKYDVGFARCEQCGSLQTDKSPYWLAEAYADQRRFLDTGAVVRNQTLQVYAWYLRWAFRLAPSATALDWGGSDGLFTRMLRDIGFDAFHSDKYALNTYAAGFEDLPGREYDLITSFEVYEHLPEPAQSIAEIFARQPKVHFIATSLYSGQGKDWGYIWPSTGRHVFFFSEKAMQFIADKYRYSLLRVGPYMVFYRVPLSSFRRSVLARVLSGQNAELFRAIFAVRRHLGRASLDRALIIKERELTQSQKAA